MCFEKHIFDEIKIKLIQSVGDESTSFVGLDTLTLDYTLVYTLELLVQEC